MTKTTRYLIMDLLSWQEMQTENFLMTGVVECSTSGAAQPLQDARSETIRRLMAVE